jgi:hypothetical protein
MDRQGYEKLTELFSVHSVSPHVEVGQEVRYVCISGVEVVNALNTLDIAGLMEGSSQRANGRLPILRIVTASETAHTYDAKLWLEDVA